MKFFFYKKKFLIDIIDFFLINLFFVPKIIFAQRDYKNMR